MTITLKPTTEALLREKAQQDGQDLDTLVDMLLAGSLEAREDEETGVAVSRAMAAPERRYMNAPNPARRTSTTPKHQPIP